MDENPARQTRTREWEAFAQAVDERREDANEEPVATCINQLLPSYWVPLELRLDVDLKDGQRGRNDKEDGNRDSVTVADL